MNDLLNNKTTIVGSYKDHLYTRTEQIHGNSDGMAFEKGGEQKRKWNRY